MEVFVEKWGTRLDLIVKLIAFSVPLMVVIGFSVVWYYLYQNNLLSELNAALTSSSLLFLSGVLGFALLAVITLTIFIPVLIVHSLDSFSLNDLQVEPNKKLWRYFVLYLLPNLTFLMAYFDFDVTSSALGSILIALLISAIYLRHDKKTSYPEAGKNKWKRVIGRVKGLIGKYGAIFMGVYLYIFLHMLFLLLVLLAIGQKVAESYQLETLGLFLFIYALFASLTHFLVLSWKDRLVVFWGVFFIIVALFFTNVCNMVAKNVGLGAYETDLILDAKKTQCEYLSDHGFGELCDIDKSKQVLRINPVWVVLKLPNLIVLSPNEDSSVRYKISASAYLGEMNNR